MLRRTAATYNINNVQKLVKTPNSFHNPDKLMEYYNQGYRLKYNLEDLINQADIVPKNIILKNTNSGKYKVL